MGYGTWKAYEVPGTKPGSHFGGSSAEIPGIGQIGYIGLTAFVLNLLVALVLTLVLKAVNAPSGTDQTSPADYTAEVGDPHVAGETPPAIPTD